MGLLKACLKQHHNISVHPDLATHFKTVYLLYFLNNSLVCQKGQFTLHPCLRGWFVRKKIQLLFPEI